MSLLELYTEQNKKGNYTLGKMLLDCLQRKPPNEIFQIDGATGEEETNASVLSRSIQLARSLRKLGFQPGDVLALGGRNHIDLHIPYYAALFNGMPVSGVDPYFRFEEIKSLFKIVEPKVAFCQKERFDDYKKAVQELGLKTRIVSFDGDSENFAEIMNVYTDNEPIDRFVASEIDTDKVYAWLTSTSGTTGGLKVAAIKHQVVIDLVILYLRMLQFQSSGSKLKVALHLSPVQWLTSFYNALSMPITNVCKLQTSKPDDVEHVIDIINKYKPVNTIMSPSLLWSILVNEKHCDLTCFETISIVGSRPYKDLYVKAKVRMNPYAVLMEAYGQTETIGPAIMPNPRGPVGSCGIPSPTHQIKLVDPATGKEITEPNVTGELWIKGPRFSEYYNDEEATVSAFSPDGWYKSGDLLYHDENNNYFFVDRIKMLIKCRGYHIIPPELEDVISTHPGVLQVCVTSIPHDLDSQRPVACVVRRPGSDVTAYDIKNLVSSKLSEHKHLTGGVVFLDEMPMTSTGKPARAKIAELVKTLERELADE